MGIHTLAPTAILRPLFTHTSMDGRELAASTSSLRPGLTSTGTTSVTPAESQAAVGNAIISIPRLKARFGFQDLAFAYGGRYMDEGWFDDHEDHLRPSDEPDQGKAKEGKGKAASNGKGKSKGKGNGKKGKGKGKSKGKGKGKAKSKGKGKGQAKSDKSKGKGKGWEIPLG